MNLYDEATGDLDYSKARAELRGADRLSNDLQRGRLIDTIAAAALLDIAQTLADLRIDTLGPSQAHGGYEPTPEPVDLTRAEAGTRVEFVTAGIRPGTRIFATLTGDQGVTEGAPWVAVLLDGEEGEEAGVQRAWVADLAAVTDLEGLATSPVPLVGIATEAEAPALRRDDDGEGEDAVGGYDLDAPVPALDVTGTDPIEPEHLVDDIDADFDGDEHPEAADAVAALKARKKAAKGKKS